MTKPPASDPRAAPEVFAKVRAPTAAESEGAALRSAAPTSVKNTPERNATGNISGTPTRAMASGPAIRDVPKGARKIGEAA